jgi:membrane protein DedA with SNARE-associated domain
VTAVPPPAPSTARRWRPVLLTLASLRYLIPIAALPLVPLLVPDRVELLTLVRPGKEILLLGGGLSRTAGAPTALIVLLAYLPLMVGGVWVFFAVGRAYAHELQAGTGPQWLHRAVPQEQLLLAQRLLARRGPTVAVLGRLAALPPTLVAAAAGTSAVSTRRFLVADLIGALAGFAVTFGLGMALGTAYEEGGPWLTAGGVVLLVLALMAFTRWVRAEAARAPA